LITQPNIKAVCRLVVAKQEQHHHKQTKHKKNLTQEENGHQEVRPVVEMGCDHLPVRRREQKEVLLHHPPTKITDEHAPRKEQSPATPQGEQIIILDLSACDADRAIQEGITQEYR